MNFNQHAKRSDDFVNYMEVLHLWMVQSVNPVLESLPVDKLSPVLSVLEKVIPDFIEKIIEGLGSSRSQEKFLVDTSSDFTLQEIWQRLIVSTDNSHLRRIVHGISEAVRAADETQYEKVLKGFDDACRQARKIDVLAAGDSLKDFLPVFRQKNPFQVRDLSLKL